MKKILGFIGLLVTLVLVTLVSVTLVSVTLGSFALAYHNVFGVFSHADHGTFLTDTAGKRCTSLSQM